MAKLSKDKQWEKGIRIFDSIRKLTVEFESEVKSVELAISLREDSFTESEVDAILKRGTSRSLNRIRDYFNRHGGDISDQWVSQVTWIRNMASHSVVWRDSFWYAPYDEKLTSEFFRISGFLQKNAHFKSPLRFDKQQRSKEFHEFMRFFEKTLKTAIQVLKTQILPALTPPGCNANISSFGSTLTLTEMRWSDYLAEMPE